MDVEGFCRQSHVIIVIGKGGVGKTTVSAALSLVAARKGLNVLVGALDDSTSLPRLFDWDEEFGYDEVIFAGGTTTTEVSPFGSIPGQVRGRVLTSDGALIEYLENHGLGRVSKRLVQTGALDVVATAIPGVRDLLVLGKIKQLEREQAADLIVLDAPASGHAITLLTSSSGLFDAARGGPLRVQAEQVLELLRDPARCQVLLVTIPEETPVNEAIETAFRVEDETGVFLGPVVVNRCYRRYEHLDSDPGEAARDVGLDIDDAYAERIGKAARFRRGRQDLQLSQISRLAHELPLAHIELPHEMAIEFGPQQLNTIADALQQAIGAL